MTTRVTVTLSRPKSVRKRSWVSGRGGMRFSSGKAMPVASAAPIAMAKRPAVALALQDHGGLEARGIEEEPDHPASCGAAAGGAGVCAGRRAGAATSTATMRSGSPMCGTRASLAIFTLLRRALRPARASSIGPGSGQVKSRAPP